MAALDVTLSKAEMQELEDAVPKGQASHVHFLDIVNACQAESMYDDHQYAGCGAYLNFVMFDEVYIAI